MANKYYEPGRQRAAKVQDLFSAIAHRYDLINDLQSFGLHRFWKRRLLKLAGIQSCDKVLDLCCGTGDVALRAARFGANVVGADFSSAMLETGIRRSQAANLSVQWVRADALQLPFRDAAFDVAAVSYGLRNLADVEGGLREMLRVTRPGGRILVLDFGKPPNPLLRRAYFAYLRFCVPHLGRWLCGDAAAYSYILESLVHYPAQEGIAQLMRKLHCERVSVQNLLGGMMSINAGLKRASTDGRGSHPTGSV
ncbi:MAG: ubiquinone/menaquinone biosynthesis methyltransferase [Verrucomicrobiia bacterium]